MKSSDGAKLVRVEKTQPTKRREKRKAGKLPPPGNESASTVSSQTVLEILRARLGTQSCTPEEAARILREMAREWETSDVAPPLRRQSDNFPIEALHNLPLPVLGITQGGMIQFANGAALRSFGRITEEMRGRHIFDLFDARCHDALADALAGFWESRRLGATVPASDSFTAVGVGSDGRHIRFDIALARADQSMAMILHDVTQASLLRSIIDYLPSGVSLIDEDLRVVATNREFKRLLDLPEWLFVEPPKFDEVYRYNQQRGEYGPAETSAKVADFIGHVGRFEAHRIERVRPNGVILEALSAPLPGGGLVTIHTDITERKIAERRLQDALQEAENSHGHLRAVIEQMPLGVTVADKDLNIMVWNSAVPRILDMPESFWTDQPTFEGLFRFNARRGDYGAGDVETLVARRMLVARAFKPHRFEQLLPNGKIVEIQATPLADGGMVTTYADVTEFRRAAETQRETVAMLHEVLSRSAIAVWELDVDGCFVRIEGPDKLFGKTASELRGKNFINMAEDSEDRAFLMKAMERRRPFHRVTICRMTPQKGAVWVSTSGQPIYGPEGAHLGFRGVDVDVTEKHLKDMEIRKLMGELKEAALHDPLTGLANRTKFHERFLEEVHRQRRSRRAISLLVVDIDFFKRINDTYGHLAGDEVLKKVAMVLQARLRDTDLVARFGGEEFVVLLPETGLKGGNIIAEKLRADVEDSFFSVTDGAQVKVTVSIGAAVMSASHPRPFDDLMEAADRAAYRAKDGGRNQVCVARKPRVARPVLRVVK